MTRATNLHSTSTTTLVVARTEADTAALGAALAQYVRSGDIIALEGPLGSGKTVFARGFIRALCDENTVVPSPTFTLVQIYDAPEFPVWHCDLYRLEDEDDALEIGLEEAFSDAVTLIEWPDRLGRWLPHKRLSVAFAGENRDGSRRIVLDGDSGWRERLEGLTVNAAT
ncbi:MAG: tRNA (adenosine(37)-N6)-threonylcarbamoyltransferase complex ATPase subunit type 1 TsaE [Rhodospirillaceae bacterium]|nr:tRNA (adenosine(37)-N6)-threonylcarbamoyltransferase complex ATPase subunit type 1 TsaE [Rhodospirillaceae bacterium]